MLISMVSVSLYAESDGLKFSVFVFIVSFA